MHLKQPKKLYGKAILPELAQIVNMLSTTVMYVNLFYLTFCFQLYFSGIELLFCLDIAFMCVRFISWKMFNLNLLHVCFPTCLHLLIIVFIITFHHNIYQWHFMVFTSLLSSISDIAWVWLYMKKLEKISIMP